MLPKINNFLLGHPESSMVFLMMNFIWDLQNEIEIMMNHISNILLHDIFAIVLIPRKFYLEKKTLGLFVKVLCFWCLAISKKVHRKWCKKVQMWWSLECGGWHKTSQPYSWSSCLTLVAMRCLALTCWNTISPRFTDSVLFSLIFALKITIWEQYLFEYIVLSDGKKQ